MSSRRDFIATSFQSVGLATVGSLLWAGYGDLTKKSPLVLRPPGALNEKDFLSACIKCDLCSIACKNRDTNIDLKTGLSKEPTIKVAKAGGNTLIGTPYFTPRDIPCYMCEDIPCAKACPSGALDMKTLLDKNNKANINNSSMGLAVIHKESCIAFWGIQCDACYRVCPLMDDALTLEYKRNKRTGKHSYLLPVVNSNSCTGCGLCEQACISEKSAIVVLPDKISKGRAGDHYVKGWDEKDQQRVKNSKGLTTKTKHTKENITNYLNESSF